MKRMSLAAIMVFMILALTGCGGGGDDQPPLFVTQILSDPAFDGDIAKNPVTSALTVSQDNTQSVFAGIEPGTNVEYRAFLDFPLTGAGGVPGDAFIASAILDVVISSIAPNPLTGTIPIRIDLVNFQPPTLIGTDFDRTSLPALVTTLITPPISQADFGNHVSVDVTSLMQEAQRLGLLNFQVRILVDPGTVSPGLVEINDTTTIGNRDALAPLLQVTYF